MEAYEEAKSILTQTCDSCKHYKKVEDQEFCLMRKWSGQTGYAVAYNNKRYGVSAIPIYDERTCNKWEIK